MVKKILFSILAFIIIIAGIGVAKYGKTMYDFLHIQDMINIEDELYLVLGGGSNSGLILGDEKAVLIDTKMGKYSKRLKKIVAPLIGDRELIIINTHIHGDHTRGNELYGPVQIFAGDYTEDFWVQLEGKENLPTNWVRNKKTIDLGNEIVELIPVGRNHTRADLLVYLKNKKVLFTGDILMNNMHAVILNKSEPDVRSWKKLLTEYAEGDLEIDIIVPGHGPLAVKNDLLKYVEYFNDFGNPENSLQKLKKKYKQWDALPFLANSKKTYNHFKELNKNTIP